MLERDIRILLQEIAIQTRKKYAKTLRELGLHIGQELALFHLWEQDGIPQARLRNKIGTEASTMSNMLRKLEHDDIVYRQSDANDHRISNVYLTDKGRQLQDPIEDMWKAHEETLLDGISSEQMAVVRTLLQQMSSNLR